MAKAERRWTALQVIGWKNNSFRHTTTYSLVFWERGPVRFMCKASFCCVSILPKWNLYRTDVTSSTSGPSSLLLVFGTSEATKCHVTCSKSWLLNDRCKTWNCLHPHFYSPIHSIRHQVRQFPSLMLFPSTPSRSGCSSKPLLRSLSQWASGFLDSPGNWLSLRSTDRFLVTGWAVSPRKHRSQAAQGLLLLFPIQTVSFWLKREWKARCQVESQRCWWEVKALCS
jgi:hypothetical protein